MKIAYTSPFVPPEWLAAHGCRPYRVVPRSSASAVVTAGTGLCPFARALAGTLATDTDIDAAILTTACDQMRRLEELILRRRNLPLFLMNVPATTTDSSFSLYLSELQRLGRFLQSLGCPAAGDPALSRNMLEYESRQARDIANEQASTEGSDNAIHLALLGGPLLHEHLALYDMIGQLGGRLALDATQDSPRTQPHPYDPQRLQDAPLHNLAERYWAIPDAFRRPNNALFDWLIAHLAERKVDGVIFVHYLWCDTWQAEAHRFRERLERPMLDLDMGDGEHDALNRSHGRLQAFMETLSWRK